MSLKLGWNHGITPVPAVCAGMGFFSFVAGYKFIKMEKSNYRRLIK
jgi:hypothetical protein